MFKARFELLFGVCVVLGCSGQVQNRHVDERAAGGDGVGGAAAHAGGANQPGGMANGGAAAEPSAGAPGAGMAACEPTANPPPLQALSSWEYRRSVAALTGTAVSAELPPDTHFEAMPFAFAMSLDGPTLERLLVEAEAQAAAAPLTQLVPCDLATVSGECADAFVANWVSRVWRRTLTPAERSRYVSLFKLGSGNGDFAAGFRLVMEAALISPLFLHKVYLGDGASPSGGTPLSSFELASRLSLLFSGEPPDAELSDVAEQGGLLTGAGLASQAQRLVGAPGFIASALHFHEQWLGLDQLSGYGDPELGPELLDSMREETQRFVEAIFQGSRRLPELLTTHETFVDWRLAPRYGLSVPEGDFVKVELDPTRYVGVLTQSSLLAHFKNPTQRGKFVSERLLCNLIPPPPPSVPPLGEILPGQTRRQAWEQHQTNPACAACHTLMDPIGYGFEHFDSYGVYQETEQGLAIDSTGQISQGGDADGPFTGVVGLAETLAKSEAVSKCMTRHWFGYALQRSLLDSDACQVDAIHAAFKAADFDMAELVLAIVESKAFSYRDPYVVPDVPPAALPSGTATDPIARRKLVLDFSLAEAGWLVKVVPQEDRPRVEQFMTALRDVQVRLSQVEPGAPPQP